MKAQMKKMLATKGIKYNKDNVKLSSLNTDEVFKIFLQYFTVDDLKGKFFAM